MNNLPENIVRVATVPAYDIVVGQDLLPRAGALLAPVMDSKKVCIVTDETVAKLYLMKVMKSFSEAGLNPFPPVILPVGEGTKNFQQLQFIVEKCLSYKLDRSSTIAALGGGVVGDIAGFAASMLMRGTGFAQIPTTLLSQVDSSVGGKTGINVSGGKNMVGSFYHPRIVLIDTDALKSLPPRELKAGYAEILKYALIDNPPFFDWLEQNGIGLLEGDSGLQKYAIDVSCRAKKAFVEADEKEQKGIRALLNLGHSFGHALEALGEYDGRLLHGEAVGIGLLLTHEFSAQKGLCPQADVERVRKHLQAAGLMTEPPFRVTAQDMQAQMRGDKKNRDGKTTLILTRGIGRAFTDSSVDETTLAEFLQKKFG